MRTMRTHCELLVALQPGPLAYDAANPDPLRCCERETWSFHDDARGRSTLCRIALRKRARPGESCPGDSALGGTSSPRHSHRPRRWATTKRPESR